MFFKRIPTAARINDSIYELEKSLLTNQHNLDHYQALVNSNLASLKRLRQMQGDGEIKVPATAPETKVVAAKSRLRAA